MPIGGVVRAVVQQQPAGLLKCRLERLPPHDPRLRVQLPVSLFDFVPFRSKRRCHAVPEQYSYR